MLKALVIAGEVEEHAVAKRLGDAAGALAKIARHVVLSEIVPRLEQHDRLLLAELMVENARQARIGTLGHSRRISRGLGFFRIVVNQEVLSLFHLPVKLIVLNLVLSEIALRLRRRVWRHRRDCDSGEHHTSLQRHAPAP